MRKTPPMCASRTMFMDNPRSMHLSEIALDVSHLMTFVQGADLRAEDVGGRVTSRLHNYFNTDQQPAAAYITDTLVLFLQLTI